jgi:poly(glycerol-phosphate) alpha-glucosyltransferase
VLAGREEIGHGDLLRRMTRQLGITDSVVFAGTLFGAEKDNALRCAKAFVLPSISEALPLAILEAWAYGLPVLMTPQCHLPEGFAAGAALKAEPDVESLTQALRTLFSMSESEREEMGARGRRLVQQKFSWPRVAEQMVAVYRWVLGGGPRPDCVQA